LLGLFYAPLPHFSSCAGSYPLAQSSGKIFALLNAHKARGGDKAKKLFQF
jgi:hypothetical protein